MIRERANPRGISFTEMVLAIGLLAVIILGVALLSLTIIRSTTESNDRIVSASVANTLLDRVVREAQSDSNFWDNDHVSTPYLEDKAKLGDLEYDYSVYAETVVDSSGTEVGTDLSNNRLKKVTIVISWMDTKTSDRQGYGKLNFSVSRLVGEEGP